MAIQRLLYSTQSVFVTIGGHLRDVSGTFDFRHNTSAAIAAMKNVKDAGPVWTSGFDSVQTFILPVQSASVDETVPQEDVMVLGSLGGVERIQKDVASSKCNLKCYLAEHMDWYDYSALRSEGNTQVDENSITQTNMYDPRATGHDENPATSGNVAATAVDPAVEQPNVFLEQGPFPGITSQGRLAGENWVQNSKDNQFIKGGMLEQLIFEAQGGYESRVEMYHAGGVPSAVNTDSGGEKDGFSFFGILNNISIDASKGAYPTLDLSWEGVGRVHTMYMGPIQGDGSYTLGSGSTATGPFESVLTADTGGTFFINKCHPHTSDDVLIWGREQTYTQDASTLASGESSLYGASGTSAVAEDNLVLIASNSDSYYQHAAGYGAGGGTVDIVGQALDNITGETRTGFDEGGPLGTQGNADTINSAKMSLDLPTETLTALGATIAGGTMDVRGGNATFSKPPFKASLTLDGQGLVMAGHEMVIGDKVIERILPNEIQIGELHCVLGVASTSVSSRSFSQAVGDVGASYNVSVEGTEATFYGTYQRYNASTTDGVTNDWNTMRDVPSSF